MSSLDQNLDHLKIPLQDILKATNHFSNKNFIRQGGFGKIYKGKLKRSGKLIDIVARRLDTRHGQGSKQFWTEILMLSKLEHPNIVSLVGFCDEKNEMIVVNNHEAKGSLDNYICDPSLTWGMRLCICIDIARALSYIYYDEKRGFSVIHRNIKSSKILLDYADQPKLAGFELSMTTVASQRDRLCIDDACGSTGYVDPTYVKTGSVTHKSDIYSFGVLLFEVSSGMKAITDNRDTKLAKDAVSRYEEGQLYDMISPYLREQVSGDSFKIFAEIAYDCLKEYRAGRPNIHQVLKKLMDASRTNSTSKDRSSASRWVKENPIIKKHAFEGTSSDWKESQEEKNNLQISLVDIRSATQNFSPVNLIGEGGFGKVYIGKLSNAQGHKSIAVKRLDKTSDQGENELLTELVILSEYKHKNIIDLVSYCNENGEKVIVYDYAARGSLDKWLKRNELNWRKRLEICVDIARGLDFLHGTSDVKLDVVIHRDIKSANILLHDDWKASIADFGLSLISPINQDINYVIDNAKGTPGYCDPLYITTRTLTKESDIYSFGVLLFEMLCGRFVMEHNSSGARNLVDLVRHHIKEGTLYEMVFEATKKQMGRASLNKFQNIAYQCIHEERSRRPTTYDVLIQLQKALELQEKWEHLLNISLDNIMLATQDFTHDNLIEKGDFWSVYKGQLTWADGCEMIIAVKRLHRLFDQRETESIEDLEVLIDYTHENIISLIGYCNDKEEKIMVYDYASISKGNLGMWLKYDGLTWRKRLEICIDIARGLVFLHETSGTKQQVVIHGDIKSSNVLLHGDWKAKIAFFGCSLIRRINKEMIYVVNNAKGTGGYCDPLNTTTGVLTKESDIYSFGVLLYEMLCGRSAVEHNSSRAHNLVHLVRDHFEEGTLYEIVFDTTKRDLAPKSLTIFLNIAHQCLHEERSKRPTANDVLIQLKKSLELQEKIEHLNISLEDIMLATQDFSIDNLIGKGGYGPVYKGHVSCTTGCEIIAVKHLDRMSGQRETERVTELEVLLEYKHENLIALLGCCNEKRANIMVYEYASKGSLDMWLKYDGLTWRRRLEICIDIARGLAFLHGTSGSKQEVVIHGDIKSAHVLINDDWKAKIAHFGSSLIRPVNQEIRYVVNNAKGTPGYCDPLNTTTGVLTIGSDIYSFGVLLFEMLCGRFVVEHDIRRAQNLVHLVRDHFEKGTLYEIVFEATKRHLAPKSLTTFLNIAYQCLHEERSRRPTANDVLIQLKKSLELQEIIEQLNISLDNIMLATQDFSLDNLIGKEGSGPLYKGQVTCVDGCEIIAVKRLDRKSDQRETERVTELEVLLEYKHENLIALLGRCNEKQENIMVYEYASKGSLDRWLKYDGLTWRKRLEICIDIASGLAFLHGTSCAKQEVVIHGDIKSAHVLLNDDWKAKIAHFGCSLICPVNKEMRYVVNNAKGTPGYCDPLNTTTGVLTKESDIFSFGVLLTEILCGRSVMEDNSARAHNLVHLVRDHFEEGTLYEIVFEATKRQLAPKSLTTFLNIAYQCLHEERSRRPTANDVLIQLKKSLELQEKIEHLNISVDDIMFATQDFSLDNLIGNGGSGPVYKGQFSCAQGCEIIAVKRLDMRSDQRETERVTELEVLLEYKHENLIALLGRCNEKRENIMVYEYASRGSLDRWLKYDGLTWRKRLEICIDIARGLTFLHGTSDSKQEVVIHRDIKSKNVLLHGDWKAKIAYLGCSLISPANQEMKYVVNNPKGTPGYCDPLYTTTGVLTKESDIYSFGVLLFEMLCGRFVMEHNSCEAQNLVHMVKRHFEEGKLSEMVFEAAKKQIVPESLTTFQKIAYKCILEERAKRPTANDVLIQLQIALKSQEELEVWEPRLPRDYKQIIQLIDSHEINSAMSYENIYALLRRGSLLRRDNKVWFSIGDNGKRVQRISARIFHFASLYMPIYWIPMSDSRFDNIARVFDSSCLKIQIKIKTQLLSPGVNYGVYLLYKSKSFRKSSNEYMELRYKIGNKYFHSHYTEDTTDGWSMIKLYQFLNLKEGVDIDIFVEGFSGSHSKYQVIYIEGVEFRAISNMTDEEIKELEKLT